MARAFPSAALPVGSSDFATSAYSYSEVPDDYEMKNFSLARDEKSILPAVLAARQINPDLQLFASPWSPPGWMKLSGKMDGGGKGHENNRLRDEEPIYTAYALYFEKYLAGHLIEALVKDYPGLRFMHTEASCDDSKNNAKQARNRFGEMIGNFNNGCDNYAYWNMLLDENQKSRTFTTDTLQHRSLHP